MKQAPERIARYFGFIDRDARYDYRFGFVIAVLMGIGLIIMLLEGR